MGCNQSKVICNLPSRSVGFEYMCIVIRAVDLMSVILGTDHEISIIRQAIEETWPGGIQQEAFVLNGLHEFKLLGNPFRSTVLSSPINEISSRKMAGNILHRLYRDGWKLQISSDLTRTVDLTTWIFKKDATAVCPSLPFLMVDLIGVDSLMVFHAPLDLHHMFKDVIEKSWPHGIQRWTYENDVLLIKLNGTPWLADGWATMHARVILQTLVTELLLKQWKLYGNFNLRRGAHTLCFEYDPNVAPGVELSLAIHFTVSFNSHDLLRLIGAPEDLVSVVRNTIRTFWSRGIQEEKDYNGSWQFKLHGTPWHVTGDESVDSRYLIVKVLEALQAHEWSVAAAIDCSRKLSDKSSLLFRRCQPRQSQFFCVSLNGSSQLWLINATEDVTKICQDVIQSQYILGIATVRGSGTNLEFKLLGNPWSFGTNGHDGIHGRNMILHLFHALASHHWRPVTSADVSAIYINRDKAPDYPLDVDSIFFTYDPREVATSTPPYAPPPSDGLLPE